MQVPHEVQLAIPRGMEPPRLDYPPTRVFIFSGKAFNEGIEKHRLDGINVPVYCPEKTLADCFKYRNKIGFDVVMEALKMYHQRNRFNLDALLRYARICRVENIMRPYLEALL